MFQLLLFMNYYFINFFCNTDSYNTLNRSLINQASMKLAIIFFFCETHQHKT